MCNFSVITIAKEIVALLKRFFSTTTYTAIPYLGIY